MIQSTKFQQKVKNFSFPNDYYDVLLTYRVYQTYKLHVITDWIITLNCFYPHLIYELSC